MTDEIPDGELPDGLNIKERVTEFHEDKGVSRPILIFGIAWWMQLNNESITVQNMRRYISTDLVKSDSTIRRSLNGLEMLGILDVSAKNPKVYHFTADPTLFADSKDDHTEEL